MPYLPPTPITQTVFPPAYGRDLAMRLKMIREKYDRAFPALSYFSLVKSSTLAASTTPISNAIVGAPGATQFDPLWGESVDPALQGGEWKQPHLSGDTAAENVDQFLDPVTVHGDVQREAQDKDLKRWGFEKIRDLIVTIPLLYYDLYGITARAGDKIEWAGSPFDVTEVSRDGFWMNSSVALYAVCNCRNRVRGS